MIALTGYTEDVLEVGGARLVRKQTRERNRRTGRWRERERGEGGGGGRE